MSTCNMHLAFLAWTSDHGYPFSAKWGHEAILVQRKEDVSSTSGGSPQTSKHIFL